MVKSIFFWILATVLLATVSSVEAQQTEKVQWIGFLSIQSFALMKGRLDVLRQGLRDLGWIEGKNLAIEYRFASGNKLALELVKLDVDVIVTSGGTQPALAAKNATWTIPIIFAGSGDPVAYRLVLVARRPGVTLLG